MKASSLALSLTCMITISFAQEHKKAQVKIEDPKKAEERTTQEISYVTDIPKNHDDSHEGYVIDAKGFKLLGTIKYNGTSKAFRFIGPSGKTDQYNAHECMEFGYDSYRFESTGATFLEVVYDLKSICVYKTPGAMGGPKTIAIYGGGSVEVDRNGDGIPYYIRKKSQKEFRAVVLNKKFSEYFADCPYLHENIRAKQFRSTKDDVTAIAAIYDRECAPANK